METNTAGKKGSRGQNLEQTGDLQNDDLLGKIPLVLKGKQAR